MKKDSLKKRFSFNLLSNAFSLMTGLLLAGIVPRSLGPENFGNYSFLTNFFQRVFGFFDTGTSSAFYAKLSQNPANLVLLRLYWFFIAFVGIIVTGLLLPVSFSSLPDFIWPEQKIIFVWMAMGWAFFELVSKVIVNIIDANLLSVKGAMVRMILRTFRVVIILGMLWAGLLNLFNYFIFEFSVLFVLIVGLLISLRKNKAKIFPRVKISSRKKKIYLNYFYRYSRPLLLLSLIGISIGILERWLLQKYGGSVEQGYFGFSQRIGQICFIFTSAAIPLFFREFAYNHGKSDFGKMKKQYVKYSGILFTIAAYLTIFASVNALKIGTLLGGAQFVSAKNAIMIMSLYPLHQTLGQMNGSFFLATASTSIYSRINVVLRLVGLPVVLLLLLPGKYGGLELGAFGLAIQMVSMQIIGIYVEIWFIAKSLKFSWVNIVGKQILTAVILGVLAYTISRGTDTLIHNSIISLLISGTFYSLLVFSMLWKFPQLMALSKQEILVYRDKIQSKLHSV